jgi:hypothetical protein
MIGGELMFVMFGAGALLAGYYLRGIQADRDLAAARSAPGGVSPGHGEDEMSQLIRDLMSTANREAKLKALRDVLGGGSGSGNAATPKP